MAVGLTLTSGAAIQANHPDVPDVILIVASGSKRGGMKLGHFAQSRWAVGKTDSRHEVLVGAEGLQLGPIAVLGTLLHEAAHGMALVRKIEDTSRGGRYHNKRFAKLAAELDIAVEHDATIGYSVTTVPDETAILYADTVNDLAEALTFYRRTDVELLGGRVGGGSGGTVTGPTGTSRNNPRASCGCGRILRASRKVLDEGPILCGLCGQEFTADED